MTSRCPSIRPLLYRVIESEASPDEAMAVARHVADCTACKIMLARQRRLSRMLEDDLPELPVGEDFVDRVMQTLPDGPPPGERRRGKGRRGIKLAMLGGLVVGGLMVASQGWASAPSLGTRLAMPRIDLGGDAAPRGIFELAQWAWAAVEALAAGLPEAALAPAVTLSLGLATILLIGCGMASASALCAVAAGSVLRWTSRSAG